jgi:hypothetical protein
MGALLGQNPKRYQCRKETDDQQEGVHQIFP